MDRVGKNQWGGARPGAGRPKKPHVKVPLSQEHLTVLQREAALAGVDPAIYAARLLIPLLEQPLFAGMTVSE